MKDDRFEELLREAVADSCNGMLDSLPGPEELEELTFSPAFETKMTRLIARIGRRDRIKGLLANAAAVFFVLLMGAGIWLAVNVEARAAFTTWIREIYEDSFVYRFFSPAAEEEMPEYTIGWVPEGYYKISSSLQHGMGLIIYTNGADVFTLTYQQISPEGAIGIFSSDSTLIHEKVKINDYPADFYLDPNENNANSLVWIDEKNEIAFCITAIFTQDVMIRIANSAEKR